MNKKILLLLSTFTVCFLIVGCAKVVRNQQIVQPTSSTLTSNTVISKLSFDFLNIAWSKNNPYPEWYGGRYINDGTISYVIVNDYKDKLSLFSKSHTCVFKKYSYNELMATSNEIYNKWMLVQSKNEAVYISSTSLDEMNNCVSVVIYPGNLKGSTIENNLYDKFGDIIKVSYSNDLSYTTTLSS